MDFKEQDYASLADELRSGPYSNKNILVCWHHGKIPELLASLGADPQKLLPPKGKWPEDVFGWFVRLEYDQNGNLNVKVQDEDLMPGDAANPPPQVKASPLSKPRVVKKPLLPVAGGSVREVHECRCSPLPAASTHRRRQRRLELQLCLSQLSRR